MAQMAMMRVMQATRMEREGRWPSEGFMRMGARTFSRLYAREKEKRFNAEGAEIGHGDRREERKTKEHSPFEAQGKQEWLCHRVAFFGAWVG